MSRNESSHTNQIGAVTKYTYDVLGRKIGETNAINEVAVFKYDASGNLTNLIDGKTQNTYWKYDQEGRVTNKVDHAQADMFRYAYDANGRLTNRWTPAKANTAYSYDAVANLTSINYSNSTDITMSYDAASRLTNIIDGVGVTRFTYASFGALLSEDGPWENDTVTYGYDNGQRRSSLSLVQPNASPWNQSYTYDSASRLSTLSSPAGTFTYKYFGGGSWITNLALPMGAAITNGYDSVGRLRATMLRASGGTILSSNTYIYDLASRRMTNARTGDVWTRYTYDTNNQLKTAWAYDTNNTQRVHEKFGYAYDAAGNVNYRTNDSLLQTFAVNNLNQLSTVSRSGDVTASGTHTTNATSVTIALNGGGAAAATRWFDGTFSKTALSFVNGTNTVTAVATDGTRYDTNTVTAYTPTSISYVYDANGNLVYDGQKAFEYDDENQLTWLTATNFWRSQFVYDGKMRRRIRREFTWQNGAWVQTNEIRYIYDANLVLQERDSFNLALVTYTRGSDLSGTFDGAGGIGGLLSRTDHSTHYPQHAYYYADGNGNVSTLIDTNQTIVARYAFEPFGNVSSMSGPLASANLYRFSSKETHTASGLAYYLYRYYDANCQRWITKDPFDDVGFQELSFLHPLRADVNLYAFVKNAPLEYWDSWGLEADIKGCRQKEKDAIKKAIKDQCKKAKSCAEKCPQKAEAQSGIGKVCDGSPLIQCVDATTMLRDGKPCGKACAKSVEGGNEVFMCPGAFNNNGCGGAGCALMHEGLHLGSVGKGQEDHSSDYKKFHECMGCPTGGLNLPKDH